MSKPREFWIISCKNYSKPSVDHNWAVPLSHYCEHHPQPIDSVHVIEYSAYEEMKRENEAMVMKV